MDDLTLGDDGLLRCRWGSAPAEYREYHDGEWGRPVADDDRVFEKLCLEGFQAGLSWLTILRKREAFRHAFAGFDPAVVAEFDTDDVERMVHDPGVVRHRGKITAAITNARATIALRAQGVSLAGLVWQHRPGATQSPANLSDVPATTPESVALSAALRTLGFAFVGPTTVYAAMQALGVVNDHLEGCHWQRITERERTGFSVPTLVADPERVGIRDDVRAGGPPARGARSTPRAVRTS